MVKKSIADWNGFHGFHGFNSPLPITYYQLAITKRIGMDFTDFTDLILHYQLPITN